MICLYIYLRDAHARDFNTDELIRKEMALQKEEVNKRLAAIENRGGKGDTQTVDDDDKDDRKKKCSHCTSYLCGKKCTWAGLSKRRAKKAAKDALAGLRAAAGTGAEEEGAEEEKEDGGGRG